MAESIIIASRLPHGLTLHHPTSKATVTLLGLNSSKIIGATHMTTEVEKSFWDAWKAKYPDYQPLKSGAIFESSSTNNAAAKAKELKDEKTGLEPMPQTAAGVKPATE